MPTLPTQQIKTTPKASFRRDLFSKLIQGTGLRFRWSRAVLCTCRLNTETSQPDPVCTRCNGDGWMHVNPLEASLPGQTEKRDWEEVDAVISSMALNPDIAQPPGGWTFGDALLTVQQEIRVSFRDRFVALESVMGWTETLTRLAGNTVPVGLQKRTTAVQAGTCRYEPVAINYVASSDDAGVQTLYYPTTDFVLQAAVTDTVTDTYEPAKIVWVDGRGPAVGVQYVVHYDCRPVWVVDDATYAIQGATGPELTLKGANAARTLPTTFKVHLDFLTDQRGS